MISFCVSPCLHIYQGINFHKDFDKNDIYIVTTDLELCETSSDRDGSRVIELRSSPSRDRPWEEGGCEIEWVDRDSSWFRAGARKGDLILEVAGEPISSQAEYNAIVSRESGLCTRQVSFTRQWDAAPTEANLSALLEITNADLGLKLLENCTVKRSPEKYSLAEFAGLTIGCRSTSVDGRKVSHRSEFFSHIDEKRRNGFHICKLLYTRVCATTCIKCMYVYMYVYWSSEHLIIIYSHFRY